jgi:hypothetical protein
MHRHGTGVHMRARPMNTQQHVLLHHSTTSLANANSLISLLQGGSRRTGSCQKTRIPMVPVTLTEHRGVELLTFATVSPAPQTYIPIKPTNQWTNQSIQLPGWAQLE